MKSFIKCLLMGGFFCGVLHASEPVKSNGVPADMVRLIVGDLTRDVPKNVAKLSPFLRGALAIAQKDEPVIKLSSKFIDESVFDLTINLLTGLEKCLVDGEIPSPIPDLTKILTTVNLPEKGSPESIALIKAAHFLGVKLLIALLVNKYGEMKDEKRGSFAGDGQRVEVVVTKNKIVKGLPETIQKNINQITFSIKELLALGVLPEAEREDSYDDEITSSIDLSYLKIGSLDGFYEVPDVENLRFVDLSHNNLRSLPERVFQRSKKLGVIVLSYNVLMYLPEKIFYGLSNLIRIDLSYNQLRYVSEAVFKGLEELNNLDLSYNQLEYVSEEVFNDLKDLDDLDLSYNMLSLLPEGLFQKTKMLNTLDLSYNKLTSLPPQIFHGLNGLFFLGLSGNQLKSLPVGIFENLACRWGGTSIVLAHNQLENLTKDIFNGNVILSTFDLSHNNLKSLPSGLFDKITAGPFYVDLANNKLKKLPEGLFEGRYYGLRAPNIDLSGNPLTELEPDVLKGVGEVTYGKQTFNVGENKQRFFNILNEKRADEYINPVLQEGGSVEIGSQGAGADTRWRAGAKRGSVTDKSIATTQTKKRQRR